MMGSCSAWFCNLWHLQNLYSKSTDSRWKRYRTTLWGLGTRLYTQYTQYTIHTLTYTHIHTTHTQYTVHTLTYTHIHKTHTHTSQDHVSVMEKAITGGVRSSSGGVSSGSGGSFESFPLVFTVPKFLPNKLQSVCAGYVVPRNYALLGYGDVGVPALLVTLALKFDLNLWPGRWTKVYYPVSGIGMEGRTDRKWRGGGRDGEEGWRRGRRKRVGEFEGGMLRRILRIG